MVSNRHFTKIIIVIMAAAVASCFLMMLNSDKLSDLLGGRSVSMEYESELFDTEKIISIDIKMDEDEWERMLSNVLSEEYYVCDVTINGRTIRNVAIRPKGNTSLSAIAMDPDSDRYSLKLEFDHFVEGQTCYGLDKLILNNNYADATNMKEALVYDMYQYLDADASLYNYAKVSVNGEYWGIYLALEAVEDSFMLRNFGTQDGELYKPDTMEMGGNSSSGSSSSSGMSMPGMDFSGFDFSDFDGSGFEGMTPPSTSGNFPSGQGGMTGGFSPGERPDQSQGMPSGEGSGFDFSNIPEGAGSGFSGRPDEEGPGFDGMPGGDPSGFDFSNIPEGSGFSGKPDGEDSGFDFSSRPDTDGSGEGPDMGAGGFSFGNGGANLNYTDDDLDSYSTIWEAEVTGTSTADHRRVVTALKNISEGNDLEKYLDVDNILKYMAVHTFSVNMDSLSGSMSHNYYLYEYDGQLNIFPWDYNLAFGGMSMSSSDATEMVNDAIDTPFSGTKFFDALLENEEYLERYHEYLRQLVEEYVQGGRFDEVYQRIRSQIDELVKEDPTAFYSYEEYDDAAEIFYEVVQLRASSIEGQLDGSIASTDEGQRKDTSSLIDASHIDVKAMGQFDMGGSWGRDSDEDETGSSSGSPSFGFFGGGFDPDNMPDMSGFSFGNMPGMSGSFGGTSKFSVLISYAAYLLVMIVLLLAVKLNVKRR